MAESYNAIAIRMGIDTSQFDAGLRRAQKQIDDVAARMAQASEENRQRANMAAGMTGMGVGVTPEDRRLSEQIATRLKINQIINQQNQLFEQNRARQQAINAETERYNRVTSTLLVNMIRRTEQAAIDNRQLAKRISANLTLNKIYNQQAAALERRAQKEAALESAARTKRVIDANRVLTQVYQQQEAALALRAQKEAALAQQDKTERIIQSNRIITEIYRQQNQLLELRKNIQKSIDAEAEKERRVLEYLNKNWEHHLQVQQRLRVVRSTQIADQIRANEAAAIADRQLAKRINANLTLNKIYNQQVEALARKTNSQEVAQAERLFQVETSRVLQSEEQLANEERIRTLREDILARATADTNRQAEEQERLAAAAEGRVQIRRMLNDEEEKTNALLALQNKQRKDLLAFQKQLDAAGLKGRSRQVLIEEFQALQAATKAEWEKGNAQKYTTELERKAEAVKNQLITAEQRHATKLANLKLMLQQNLLTQKQYAKAVEMTNHALAMQQSGMGRMSGVMAQASFAVEDFTQVLLMGGGLNMALMSASNNITYLLHTSGMITSVWGTLAISTIPLVLSGMNALVQSAQKQHQSFEEWSSELSDYFRIAGRVVDEHNDKIAHARRLEDIDVSGVSSSERANEELIKNAKEQVRLQEDLTNARQVQMGVARRAMQEEETFLFKRQAEHQRMLALLRSNEFGNQHVEAGIERRKEEYRQEQLLIEAAREKLELDLASATSAEQYRQAWMNYGSSISTITGEAAKGERQRINDMLNNADELQDSMNNQLKVNRQIEESEIRREELNRRRIVLLEDEAEARKEQLRLMRATEEERAATALQRQREEFVGISPSDIMVDPRLEQEYLQRSTDFLLAAQDQTQKQIDELQKAAAPAFTGDLQQDAFKAQAEAFKQMDQARQEKRNPQLDQQIDLLRRINDALNSGGTITLVGGP